MKLITEIEVARQQIIDRIDLERKLGWDNFHPEEICHRCGGVNIPSWAVDSDRFNMAMGTTHMYNGIICPGCFVVLHELATGLRVTWTVVPHSSSLFRHIGG